VFNAGYLDALSTPQGIRLPTISCSHVINAGNNGVGLFTLTPGVHFPAHAREVLIEYTVVYAGTSVGYTYLNVYSGNVVGGVPLSSIPIVGIPVSASLDYQSIYFSTWIALPSVYPVQSNSTTYSFEVVAQCAPVAKISGPYAQCRGYKL
jgi:hypothetical protein